ncbi:hypothetical protein J4228_03765 [Candidatus Woesearchaeota archaeon]|nr:hypothetical protein [Candidatus Woesearchaeota archaeon]
MTMQQTDESGTEFQQKKQELSLLRTNLHEIHEQKEAVFKELKLTRDHIRTTLAAATKLKQERDKITKIVQELKKQRETLNLTVKEKAGEHKTVEEKKKELLSQTNVRADPSSLKTQIRHLEEQIETEVMPFSREQQITKKIKELKSKYKQVEQLGNVWKELNTTSADFAEQRRKAQEIHHEVQHKAQESQQKHEQINSLFEEIKKKREEEQLLAEKHLELKVKYEQIKKEFETVSRNVGELAKLSQKEERKNYHNIILEKTKEVQEKMRKKEKLRTEDILAFQALEES